MGNKPGRNDARIAAQRAGVDCLKFRGNGCDVHATAATVRHFFAMDAAISRAIASYAHRNGRNKAAIAAIDVWRSFRDFAGVCVAQKADGRDVRVFTYTTAARP